MEVPDVHHVGVYDLLDIALVLDVKLLRIVDPKNSITMITMTIAKLLNLEVVQGKHTLYANVHD